MFFHNKMAYILDHFNKVMPHFFVLNIPINATLALLVFEEYDRNL